VEFSRSAPFPYSVRADLSQPESAAEVFRDTMAPLRAGVTEVVCINNAAVLEPVGSVDRATVTDVVANLDTNIASGILLARSFIAAFQDQRCPKTFVNISSGAAIKGYAGWSLYCAGKAAMENFVRSVALEQSRQPSPIVAISINPGVMDTAMQRTVRGSSPHEFPEVERFVRLHREGRLGTPADVAHRIAAFVETRPEAGGVYSAST